MHSRLVAVSWYLIFDQLLKIITKMEIVINRLALTSIVSIVSQFASVLVENEQVDERIFARDVKSILHIFSREKRFDRRLSLRIIELFKGRAKVVCLGD